MANDNNDIIIISVYIIFINDPRVETLQSSDAEPHQWHLNFLYVFIVIIRRQLCECGACVCVYVHVCVAHVE